MIIKSEYKSIKTGKKLLSVLDSLNIEYNIEARKDYLGKEGPVYYYLPKENDFCFIDGTVVITENMKFKLERGYGVITVTAEVDEKYIDNTKDILSKITAKKTF